MDAETKMYIVSIDGHPIRISGDMTVQQIKHRYMQKWPMPSFDLVVNGLVCTGPYIQTTPDTKMSTVPHETVLQIGIRFSKNIDTLSIHSSTTAFEIKEYICTRVPRSYISDLRLIFAGKYLEDHRPLVTQDIKQSDIIHGIWRQKGDIGEFDEFNWEIPSDPDLIIRTVQEKKQNYIRGEPIFHAGMLASPMTNTQRQGLMAYINTPICTMYDQKREMSMDVLRGILCDSDMLDQILTIFGDHSVDVVIRRTNPTNGTSIPFHLDSTKRTMQIPLNDPEEYTGGTTVFLLSGGSIHVTDRALGSFTLHNNHVVHGVSPVQSGVRYSLFLLATV